ncbi:MAG: RHS repeat-associated core domain-containing protein [Thermoanaerobaculia bacterium]
MTIQRFAAAVLLLVSSSLAAADENPSIGRGLAVDKLYQYGDIDSVDLQSGALSVAIPIGSPYPVSERFSYQFTLTHSSRAWDYLGASTAYTALPNRRSNSGVGWSLHLGLLIAPSDPTNPAGTTQWNYISPDGGEHVFEATLHSGEADGDTTNSVDYTRDSTYLRLKHLSGNIHEVEFPDGTIKKFENQAGRPGYEFRLTEIRDRFLSGSAPQNWVRIAYDDVLLKWTVTDSRSRSHTIQFVNLQYDTQPRPMVDFVDLAAWDGTPDGTPARWEFSYLGGGSSTIYRDCRQNNGTTLSAPILLSVAPPVPAVSGAPWVFANYNDDPGPDRLFCRQSVLSDVTLPTGGQMHYEYQTLQLPANNPCPDPLGTGEIPVLAVAERQFIDPIVQNPTVLPAVWSYEYSVNAPGEANLCGGPPNEVLPPEELTVTVWSPLNDKTEYFFSVWPAFTPSPSGFLRSEYGLPFTRLGSVGGRFLSSISFDCDAAGACAAGSEKRYEYLLYEQDPGGVRANRRVQAKRTIYNDDGGVWADTQFSSFDGVGHYRSAATSGNFDSGNSQTTTTNFNPARGTYPSPYTVLPVSEPWLLETYDRVDVLGGTTADTTRTVYNFDLTPSSTATGFLKSVRTYKTGITEGVNDVLTVFCKDTMGNVVSELFYGGDGTRYQLPQPPLPNCDSGPPASGWQYRLDHTYSSGVRSTSKYNGSAHFLIDLTIDVASGLPSSSRDSAGVETTFEYDLMGRLKRSIPQAFGSLSRSAQAEYTYWAPASGGPASVEVERCAAATAPCGASRLTDEYTEVTGFGLPWHEVRSMPDTADWAVRVSRYNAMGLKERVSSWVYDADVIFTSPNETSLSGTSYSGYDAFGRPATVTQADGAVISFVYSGVRTVQTEQKLSLTIGAADQCVRRKERFDRLGRLDRVEEAFSACTAGGTPATATEYSFDEAGHVVKVCQDKVGTTCNQQRLFSYDNRGFLTSEQHPEKGATGQGLVSYSCYDARGHNRYRDDGAATGRRLGYTFDSQERLTLLREPLSSESCIAGADTGTTWKQFTYASSNSSGQANKGKLATAMRRNEFGPSGPGLQVKDVTEFYTYSGRGGRPSLRRTEVVSGGTVEAAWQVGQGYEPLGNVNSISYPVPCAGTNCGSAWYAPTRAGSMTYDGGLLETVTGTDGALWVTEMGYHASGLVNQVFHGNGTRETVAIAANGMARPMTIDVKNAANTVLWQSGTYGYDGGGNIKTLGTDQFRYDKYSRLVEARLNSLGVPIQTYGFDVFGNMTSVTTGSTTETFPLEGVTNRLSSMSSTYDAGGNLLAWNSNHYTFDLPGQMRDRLTKEEYWSYIYTADDERLLAVGGGGTVSIWTLRGLDARVLTRAWLEVGIQDNLATVTDYAHRPGGVVASRTVSSSSGGGSSFAESSSGLVVQRPGGGQNLGGIADGVRHFGLDHLGTVRLITGPTGTVMATHTYYPFGREATSAAQDAEPLKFTGHERDLLLSISSTADDLDYMHARYRSPLTSRFLSTDPVLGTPSSPQSWNRYAYVQGNPLKFTDPTGKCVWDICVGETAAVFALTTATAGAISAVLASPNSLNPSMTNGQVIGNSIRDSFVALGSFISRFSETTAANSNAPNADSSEDQSGTSDSAGGATPSRQRGDRAKAGTAAEAEQQLAEIEAQQNRTRTGKAEGIIELTTKSEQRMKHRHDQIKDLEDAEREYE